MTNVVEIDGLPHLGVIPMKTFRETIWAPIAKKLEEVGPIRLITYSADFPYAVRFKLPDGLTKRARQIIGGQASLTGLKKTDAATKVGEALAKRLADKGIKQAVFDRNGYRYHGRVAAIAAGAREAGLEL